MNNRGSSSTRRAALSPLARPTSNLRSATASCRSTLSRPPRCPTRIPPRRPPRRIPPRSPRCGFARTRPTGTRPESPPRTATGSWITPTAAAPRRAMTVPSPLRAVRTPAVSAQRTKPPPLRPPHAPTRRSGATRASLTKTVIGSPRSPPSIAPRMTATTGSPSRPVQSPAAPAAALILPRRRGSTRARAARAVTSWPKSRLSTATRRTTTAPLRPRAAR
mmetsp:Transcript_8193/g.17366  ORF Transcript_8193/g.17366 Transcript_8193/m.17366 type:complete len:220 (-) Transcript_8193:7-666(-)